MIIAHKSGLRLSFCFNHVLAVSEDQVGSRFIQSRLSNASSAEIEQVFTELIVQNPKSFELFTHCYANYVVQKLFEVGTNVQVAQLIELIRPSFYNLSFDTFGCRVLQCAIPRMDEKLCSSISDQLFHNCIEAIHSQNANHVLQKCIEYSSFTAIDIVLSVISTHGIQEIANHTYGCRVLQRLLECDDDTIHAYLGTQLFPILQQLVIDQYGNFVIQHLAQNSNREMISIDVSQIPPSSEETERKQTISTINPSLNTVTVLISIKEMIARSLRGNYFTLSKHKFGSNVVEKCLEYADENIRRYVLLEILSTDPQHYNKKINFNQLTKALFTEPSLDSLASATVSSEPASFVDPYKPFNTHPLLFLLLDQFGNYVAQRVCDIAPLSFKQAILHQLLYLLPVRLIKGRKELQNTRSELRSSNQRFADVADDDITIPNRDFIGVRIEKLLRALERPTPVIFPEPPRSKWKGVKMPRPSSTKSPTPRSSQSHLTAHSRALSAGPSEGPPPSSRSLSSNESMSRKSNRPVLVTSDQLPAVEQKDAKQLLLEESSDEEKVFVMPAFRSHEGEHHQKRGNQHSRTVSEADSISFTSMTPLQSPSRSSCPSSPVQEALIGIGQGSALSFLGHDLNVLDSFAPPAPRPNHTRHSIHLTTAMHSHSGEYEAMSDSEKSITGWDPGLNIASEVDETSLSEGSRLASPVVGGPDALSSFSTPSSFHSLYLPSAQNNPNSRPLIPLYTSPDLPYLTTSSSASIFLPHNSPLDIARVASTRDHLDPQQTSFDSFIHPIPSSVSNFPFTAEHSTSLPSFPKLSDEEDDSANHFGVLRALSPESLHASSVSSFNILAHAQSSFRMPLTPPHLPIQDDFAVPSHRLSLTFSPPNSPNSVTSSSRSRPYHDHRDISIDYMSIDDPLESTRSTIDSTE
ncbi:putative Pumilio like protein [Blattamonas nauphoetae]|uniref:Pumilio like protein n=1 Tax=Blattamonas nauphoetae TaxID=2049346 RepID=A0ABQ9X964_9EUKA|nr:putative Pumilio like protein [Blattamonas nauphoetae]